MKRLRRHSRFDPNEGIIVISNVSATIVIPLLNQVDEWLDNCIRSAPGQTVACEVIVAVSPRTKGSNLARLERLHATHDGLGIICRDIDHFAHAINVGVRLSSSDRIGLRLIDDWLAPAAVKTCLAFDADIVSTGGRYHDTSGAAEFEQLRRRPSMAKFDALPTLEQKVKYLRHFFRFKKSAFLAVSGVDPSIGLTGADDYDLIWSMLDCATVFGGWEESSGKSRLTTNVEISNSEPLLEYQTILITSLLRRDCLESFELC